MSKLRLTASLLSVVLFTGMVFATPSEARPPDCIRKPNHPQCQTATPTPAPTTTPTPAPTATPAPTPTPTPPTGTTLYIAPTGSDSNPCTLALPCRTILDASAQLGPGDILLVRGGTYTGQGGYNWKSSGVAGNPVTIRNYPGESPLFSGANWSHGIIVSGYSHVVIDGLAFTGFGMGTSGDAAILLLNASNILIQNMTLTDNGAQFQSDHHIYINSGCANITIRNSLMDGTPGAAVHLFHDPGPSNVLIEGNTMRNGYWGVVIGSNANGVAMNGNTFSGNTINMDNQRGINVTASGNSPNDVIQ